MVGPVVAPARRARYVRPAVSNTIVAVAIWMAVASVTPTFLRAPTWVASDAGVFYSVFNQLGQGRRLYIDVFDHKDPLFYVGHTLAYGALGPRGPMLWEGALSLVLLVAVLQLGARRGLGLLARVLLAVVFAAVHFLPPVYVPVHTYQQALALALVALWLAAGGRTGVAGAVFAAAVWSKLTLATLAPGFLVFVALSGSDRSSWRGRLTRAVGGAVSTTCLVAGLLYARGELRGYADALAVNVLYPSLNPPDITTFVNTPDLWGRVVTLYTAPLATVYLALVVTSAGLALTVREPAPTGIPVRALAWLALLAFGGTLTTLTIASWWAHHFQMAGVALVLALLPLLAVLSAAGEGTRAPTIGLPRSRWTLAMLGSIPRWGALAAGVGVPMVVLGVVAPVFASRVTVQGLGWTPLDPCTMLVSVYASPGTRRPECALLQEWWPAGTRFATLQANNPGTLAAWTPPSMVLACRVFYQFVWLDPRLLDEAADCIANGAVDVVFRASPSGSYRRANDPLLDSLRSSYRLTRRHGDIEVWERRDR